MIGGEAGRESGVDKIIKYTSSLGRAVFDHPLVLYTTRGRNFTLSLSLINLILSLR